MKMRDLGKLPERTSYQLTITATTTGRLRVRESLVLGDASRDISDRVMTLDDLTADLRLWIADQQAGVAIRMLDAGHGKTT